jgi:D-glycero-alpha-D-manno-heptose-7-phosphate kinase
MIISRTPFRMSLFGGGTDYPSWYKHNESLVLAAALDYYCYISLRPLPKYFEHLSKAVYSKIETVSDNNLFVHPSIRACLHVNSITTGIELHHDSDIPARSGIGSSSSFTVGLLHAINEMLGVSSSPGGLAALAISVEQKIIGEPVGVQDQIIAAYGGVKRIQLGVGESIRVDPVNVSKDYLRYVEENTLMGFTGDFRNSTDHSGKHEKNIQSSKHDHLLKEVTEISTEAIKQFESEVDLSQLGRYLDSGWKLKKSITGSSIPDSFSSMYDQCIKIGAYGGKLMGAGGGGAFYFFAPQKIHNVIKNSFPGIKVWLPVKFSDAGSKIILRSEHQL